MKPYINGYFPTISFNLFGHWNTLVFRIIRVVGTLRSRYVDPLGYLHFEVNFGVSLCWGKSIGYFERDEITPYYRFYCLFIYIQRPPQVD